MKRILTLLFLLPLFAAGQCDTVTGLTATGVGHASATISFTAPSASLYFVLIYNGTRQNVNDPGGPYPALVTAPLNSLTPSTLYTYTIVRYCSGSDSASSSNYTFTTTAPPCDTVTNVAASVTSNSVSITSTAAAYGDSYVIYYVRDGQTDTTTEAGADEDFQLANLRPNTVYWYQIGTICGSDTTRNTRRSFTTSNSPAYTPSYNFGWQYKRLAADSTLNIPTMAAASLKNGKNDKAAIAFDTTAGVLEVFNPLTQTWQGLNAGTSSDIIVSTIASMQAYSGDADVAIVTDSLRGGIFNYYVSGLTPDDGVVFDATGKGSGYWKRQVADATGLNICWYGAVGDSATNNTTALQAAFNAFANSQLTFIQIPKGIFLFDGRLTTPALYTYQPNPGIKIRGAGPGLSKLIYTGTKDTVLLVQNPTVLGTGNPTFGIQYNAEISNFTLQTATDSCIGIYLRRYFNCRINDMIINGQGNHIWDRCIVNYYDFFPGTPRRDDYNANLELNGCLFKDFYRAGYDTKDSEAGVQIEVIRGCFFQGRDVDENSIALTQYGIYTTSHNVRIENCNIVGCDSALVTDRPPFSYSTNPTGFDNNCINVDNTRFEGNVTTCVLLKYGAAFSATNTIFDCHAALDSTLIPYMFYIPDGATSQVNYILVNSCAILPNQKSPGANWVGVYAGTNLNANCVFEFNSCRQAFTVPGGVIVKTDGTAGARWANIRIRGASMNTLFTAGSNAFRVEVDGETYTRFDIKGNGIYFGDGTTEAPQTSIVFNEVGRLTISTAGSATPGINGFIQNTPRATRTDLNNASFAINTVGKFQGKLAFDTTTFRLVYAVGGAASSAWVQIVDTANAQTIFSKTAGNFMGFLPVSAPATPTTGFRLYANTSNAFSWIGANGYIRTFDGLGITANRTYSLFNLSDSLVGRTAPQTLTNKTISGSSNTFSNIPTSAISNYTAAVMQFQSAGIASPADNTSYYIGMNSSTTATTFGNNRVYVPISGTVTVAYVFFFNAGTLASNETSTIYIRSSNGNEYTVSSSVTNDVAQTAYNNTSLSIPVVAGDYLEFRWLTPAWTTNPTTVRINCSIRIQ